MNQEQSSTICVKRKDESAGAAGRYNVLINGEVAGQLWVGQEVSFNCSPGRYIVQVKVWGFGSPSHVIDLQPNETVIFECGQGWPVGIYLKMFRVNQPVVQSNAAPAQDLNALADFEIIGEENVVESTEILGTERYPLDNTHGSDPLSVEFEVSKTVSNNISLEDIDSFTKVFGSNFMPILKAEITSLLSNKVGQSIGESVTRRQTLRLSVQPKSSVTYNVVWKRKLRQGVYVVLKDRQEFFVPYQFHYDLSYEVRTL